MSTSKTPLGLNQWKLDEKLKMADFNADNQIVDQKLRDLDDDIESADTRLTGQIGYINGRMDQMNDQLTARLDQLGQQLQELTDTVTASELSVFVATAAYAGGAFVLAGLPSSLPDLATVRFIAPEEYTEGDVMQIGGVDYEVITPAMNPLGTGVFAAGVIVVLELDTVNHRAFYGSLGVGAGGGSGSGSDYDPDVAPIGYEFHAIYNSSGLFTAPESAWYKVFVWGKSGDGGKGGDSRYNKTTGGGGGGAGGFAASKYYLERGTEIPVEMNQSYTRFGETGSSYLITAHAGANGADGIEVNTNQTVGDTKGGQGGAASGGNIANLNGQSGGNGGGVSGSFGSAGTQGGNNGAQGGLLGGVTVTGKGCSGGGGGACLPGSQYCSYIADNMHEICRGGDGEEYNSNGNAGSDAPVPVLNSTVKLYGAGSGGGGVAGTISVTSMLSGGKGGKGNPGIVIIEKAIYE